MATTTITVGGRTADPFSGQTYFYFAPLAIPLVILGVPIFDTAFSFLRRVVRRQSFAQADHEHLHHRLMRMGHGPRRAVVILWLWTALLSAVVLLPDVHQPRQLAGAARGGGPGAAPLHLLPPRRPQRPGRSCRGSKAPAPPATSSSSPPAARPAAVEARQLAGLLASESAARRGRIRRQNLRSELTFRRGVG